MELLADATRQAERSRDGWIDVNEAAGRALAQAKDFVTWVETWVSNPVGSYSVSALDGLFGMTRDRIAALRAHR